jgi:hypothetical protein
MNFAADVAFMLVAPVLQVSFSHMKSPVKSDETITFFTVAAWPAHGASQWETEIRGILFEQEMRPLLIKGLRRALGLEWEFLTDAEQALFHERARLFLADNEGGKSIPVSIGGKILRLPDSSPNGHFRGRVTFTAAAEEPVHVRALLREGDDRKFTGTILPMSDDVLPMVISDVDDTIKLTNVPDRAVAIRRTFCAPFAEIPGMAARYAQWAARGAGFHYVSGSPWQLYAPLEQFAREAGFPAGAWHLKHLRLANPETVLAFLGPQQEYKLNAIRPLVDRWKYRHFILVGDTGVQDPEIYAALAKEHPSRITRILLRNVTGERRNNPRLARAFSDLPPDLWQLFDSAEDLPALP